MWLCKQDEKDEELWGYINPQNVISIWKDRDSTKEGVYKGTIHIRTTDGTLFEGIRQIKEVEVTELEYSRGNFIPEEESLFKKTPIGFIPKTDERYK